MIVESNQDIVENFDFHKDIRLRGACVTLSNLYDSKISREKCIDMFGTCMIWIYHGGRKRPAPPEWRPRYLGEPTNSSDLEEVIWQNFKKSLNKR